MRNALFLLLIPATIVVADDSPLVAVDGATRMKWLIYGQAVDASTGKPIPAFTVTPGTISVDETGKSVVRWRDNLKIEMQNGQIRWPRTSGFSQMRFRVSAKGYRPLVTHVIRRGGPHLRMKVSLIKTAAKQ